MKTTYSRTFLTATVVLLAALLAVGFFLRALLDDYLTDSAFERLEKDAQVISELAAAYYDANNSLESMQFLINLDVAGEISEADSVICDSNGKILICSENPLSCEHRDMMVSPDYLEKVLSTGGIQNTGIIQGLYEDSRYIFAAPINHNGTSLGIVIVSRPVAASQAVLLKMTEIFIFLSVFVVLISVLVIGFFVKRQIHPLKDMANAARDFGHGDLEARVTIHSDYPQEIEELALAFNNMASSLQKSEYQRQEFVANVSHELKTPMTTIGGYIDGILDGTIPPERSRHYMQIVSDETKRLSRLVRSMLDISQLQTEAGIPDEKKTRFDLEECAGQVLITFEQKILSKGVEVEVEMPEHPVFTFANEDYVTQVIYNLLDNAVKFCPAGGTMGLRIREGGSKACISVYNDGEPSRPRSCRWYLTGSTKSTRAAPRIGTAGVWACTSSRPSYAAMAKISPFPAATAGRSSLSPCPL